jgi:ABC-type multidrug transport system fused ATPase/permease subunit
MIETYRQMMDLLTPRERRGFYLLMAIMLVVGVFETAGVASILPFMAVLTRPEIIESNDLLAAAYDRLGFASTHSFLIALGLGTFLMVMAGVIAHVVSIYAIVRFSHNRSCVMSGRLLRGYLHQPYTWFLNRHSADLGKAVLAEVDSVINHSFIPALRLIANLMLVTLITGLLVVLQPMVAIGTAAVLAVAYGLIYMVARAKLAYFGQLRFQSNAERYRIAQEATGGIKDVKLLGLEDTYIRRFQRPARRLAHANTYRLVISESPRYVLQGLAFGGMLLMILVLLVTGSGSLGGLLPLLAVYAFAGLRLLPALQQVYAQMTHIRFNQTTLARLHRDMEEVRWSREAPAEEPRRGAALHLGDRLELVDVHYAYPLADREALRGLSLTIPARATVGIVGGTGAGKTTAVDVMLGLLAVPEGALRVDGAPVTGANLRAWQNAIGYVPQAIYLTDDTVAANIAFGLAPERIDRAAVERAARIAELHDFVTGELPKGYDTLVGERGVRLSGGQRQRIGIARALYYDPDILIMDEATSALDNLTERAVMDAVHNLGHAKTIVLIAHRLSTVKDCDVIFMLEKGRLIAQGTYDELLERSGEFRAMAGGRS